MHYYFFGRTDNNSLKLEGTHLGKNVLTMPKSEREEIPSDEGGGEERAKTNRGDDDGEDNIMPVYDEENKLTSPLLQDEPQWSDRPPLAASVDADEDIVCKLSSRSRRTLAGAELEGEHACHLHQ